MFGIESISLAGLSAIATLGMLMFSSVMHHAPAHIEQVMAILETLDSWRWTAVLTLPTIVLLNNRLHHCIPDHDRLSAMGDVLVALPRFATTALLATRLIQARAFLEKLTPQSPWADDAASALLISIVALIGLTLVESFDSISYVYAYVVHIRSRREISSTSESSALFDEFSDNGEYVALPYTDDDLEQPLTA